MPFVTEHKSFWKVVKPLFNRDESEIGNEIILLKMNKIKEMTMNLRKSFTPFSVMISPLDTTKMNKQLRTNVTYAKPTDQVIKKYQFRSSC